MSPPNGGGKGKVKVPKLPKDTPTRQVPKELRDFVDCKGMSLVLKPGEVTWLDLPAGTVTLGFEHGTAPGTIAITVTVSLGVSYSMPITGQVKDGQLSLDTKEVPGEIPGLGNPRQAIDDWVKNLNDWLAQNGKRLDEAKLRRGELTLTKAVQGAWSGPGVAVPGTEVVSAPPKTSGLKRVATGGLVAGTIAMGVGGYQLATSEPPPEPEPVAVVFDPATLPQALLTLADLDGFEPVPITGNDDPTGLCGGTPDPEIAATTGREDVVFDAGRTNEGSTSRVSQRVMSYVSEATATQVIGQIEDQGSSCGTYDSPAGQQTLRIDIATDDPPAGVAGTTVAFSRTLYFTDQPEMTGLQELVYVQQGPLIGTLAVAGFDEATVAQLTAELAPIMSDRLAAIQPVQPPPAEPADEPVPWGGVMLAGGALLAAGSGFVLRSDHRLDGEI